MGAMILLPAALLAEEPAPAPAPSPQVIQDSQQRLGEQVGRIGESLEDLLQEAQANLGVELQSFDTFRHMRERLADLSQRQMPNICAQLRDPTTKALHTAWRRQDEIAGELNRLLLALRRPLAPALSRRALDAALDRQREALARTQDLRSAHPALEGIPPHALSDEQQRLLNETAEAQEQAAEELARAQVELQRQGEALSGGDVSVRQALRQVQSELQVRNVPAKAASAAEDLRANHLRKAQEKQEDVIRALKEADELLAPPVGPATRSVERLAAFQEAAGQQAQALDETHRLEKDSSEDALARAARDQGEVSGRLRELAAQEPKLEAVHAESEAAKRNLLEGETTAARQSQEKVLAALQNALREAAAELKHRQQQERRLDSASLELDRLRGLLRRQEELRGRTARVPVQRAHVLAREQAELLREAEAMGAKLPASSPLAAPTTGELTALLARLAEEARTAAAAGCASSERQLQEIRRSSELAGEGLETEDPETFYSSRELVRQAEEQVQQAQAAAKEAARAADEVGRRVGAPDRGRSLEETHAALRGVAEAALRACAAACRASVTSEQRQGSERIQAQALQAAALAGASGLPAVSDALKTAVRAMSLAVEALSDQRPDAALPRQREALAALEAGLHRLAAELGQLDLTALLALLRSEAAALADAQARLAAETLSADAVAGDLAPRQEELGAQAGRLRNMPGMPAPAIQSLDEADRRMRQAAEDLKQDRLSSARALQKRADEGLARALYELNAAAVAAQMAAPAGRGLETVRAEPAGPIPAAPVFQTVRSHDSTAGSWNVSLPPRERGEVDQALKEKMPARYRRQIMLYYENLSRIGLE